MKRKWKRFWAACLAAVLVAGMVPPAAAYESKCPRCGTVMGETEVPATCIDDGYTALLCPSCGATGTRVVAGKNNHLGHDYGSSGICSRCGDDARPPDQRPGSGISSTGSDGHTHNYKLMGNMYARKDHEGVKKWVCSVCQEVLLEDVPRLTADGMAQPGGGTFRTGSKTSSGSSSGSSGSGSGSSSGSAGNTGGTGSTGSTENTGSTGSTGSSGNTGSTGNIGGTETACKHRRLATKSDPATCTEDGRSYMVCMDCGAEVGRSSTIPKKGHAWLTKTVEATTSAGGRTYRVCGVCGEEETISTTPQLSSASASHSGSLDMKKLSQSEIEQLLASAPLDAYGGDDVYDQMPSTTPPYSAGKVKAEVLQAALDRLNVMRRIAGVPNVALDAQQCDYAQHGAVVDAAIDVLTHTPSKPAGMDDAFYKRGYTGTSSSNMARGFTLVGAIDAWMDDSDASNIDRVGHRRWQLNPNMDTTGFGHCGIYSAEWTHGRNGKGCNYNFIAWPASGNFPSSLMDKDYAWSVIVNPKLYAGVNASGLTVTLTRQSDGKTWTFQGSEQYTAASSGKYFNVNTRSSNSVGNCIIFRPDGVSSYDGTYTVSISGLRFKDGSAAEMSYQVDFFGGKAETSQGIQTPAVPGQTPATPSQTPSTPGQTPTTPGQTPVGSNPFIDVPAGSYYYDAVQWALANGVTTGVTATQFRPNAACTRGQVVTFLWRAKGCPEPKTKANPFRDVSSSSPFYKAILWAQENNITTGTTATTFSPSGTCTSAHVVTFLWRADGRPAASGPSSLATACDASAYYTGAVAWADTNGLLSGVGSAFAPGQESPRANIVTYLYRDIAL